MITDGSPGSRFEESGRNDVRHKGQHGEIRLQRFVFSKDLIIFVCCGLIHGKPFGARRFLDGIGFPFPVWRSIDRYDALPPVQQSFQGFHSKCRLSNQHDAHHVLPLP